MPHVCQEEKRERAREAGELRSALEGEKRRRARLHRKVERSEAAERQLLQREQEASADAFQRVQEEQLRAARQHKELAQLGQQHGDAFQKLLRLRGTIVEQAFNKHASSLLLRCLRAWRNCAAQHAAFKALKARGEVAAAGSSPVGRRPLDTGMLPEQLRFGV